MCWGKPASVHIVCVFCCCTSLNLELSLQTFRWPCGCSVPFKCTKFLMWKCLWSLLFIGRCGRHLSTCWRKAGNSPCISTLGSVKCFLAVIFLSQTRELLIMRGAKKKRQVHITLHLLYSVYLLSIELPKQSLFFNFKEVFMENLSLKYFSSLR